MVIVRFEPGMRVAAGGLFALVGRWGEPTGFVCECKPGETLLGPEGDVPSDEAHWFVRLERVSEERLAA